MATKWAEYKRVQRAKAKAEKVEEESKETDEAHPVYPELKKWSNREYNAQGLVLKKQNCEKCGGSWSASIPIECPYCHGHGKRKEAA